MADCKSVATPFELGADLYNNDKMDVADVPYQTLIGCLMYIAVNSRPDIDFATSFLSQFNKKPKQAHRLASKLFISIFKRYCGLRFNF